MIDGWIDAVFGRLAAALAASRMPKPTPTGKLVWQKNLVQDYKATIPGWYAGQNPLLDGDRIIIATGGDALAVAQPPASRPVA